MFRKTINYKSEDLFVRIEIKSNQVKSTTKVQVVLEYLQMLMKYNFNFLPHILIQFLPIHQQFIFLVFPMLNSFNLYVFNLGLICCYKSYKTYLFLLFEC